MGIRNLSHSRNCAHFIRPHWPSVKIFIFFFLFFLFGCKQHASPDRSKPDPCVAHVFDKSKQLDPSGSFITFESINGSVMRFPRQIGQAYEADAQCRMGVVDLKFWWDGATLVEHNGEIKIGKSWSMVDFYGSFPEGPSPLDTPVPSYKTAYEFTLPGYPNISVYPMAGWGTEANRSKDPGSPSNWRPQFAFKDVIDASGRPVRFHCTGIRLERDSGSGQIIVTKQSPHLVCNAFFRVTRQFGGRMTVLDNQFLSRGDRITSAVLLTLQSYLVE